MYKKAYTIVNKFGNKSDKKVFLLFNLIICSIETWHRTLLLKLVDAFSSFLLLLLLSDFYLHKKQTNKKNNL